MSFCQCVTPLRYADVDFFTIFLRLSALTNTTQRRKHHSSVMCARRGHWSKSFSCFTHELICLFSFFLSFFLFFFLMKLQWIIDWPECSLQCRSGARWNQRLQAAAIFPCKSIVIGRKVVTSEIYAVKQRRDKKGGNVILDTVLYI